MNLGSRLRREREDRGLTQVKAARALGISNVVLNRYEKNERQPDIGMIRKLAAFYDVSCDYLICITDERRSANRIKDDYETYAAHRIDDPMTDLPPEARKSLEEFLEFVRAKYGLKKD